MVLAHYDLGRHVAGSARSITRVLFLPNPCEPQINQLDVAFVVEDDICGTHISVNHAVVVQEFQGDDNACNNKLSLVLTELLLLVVQEVAEVAAGHVL